MTQGSDIRMAEAEQKLWQELQTKPAGFTFRRQVAMQKYIADFVCDEAKLIVELDGAQDAVQSEYNRSRDQFFKDQGYKILRFWNNEVAENTIGVLSVITETLNFLSASSLVHEA